MDFGKRLKELREKRGFTQEELAYKINERTHGSIKRTAVSNYENNVSKPDFYSLLALGDIFGISLDFLMDFKKPDAKSIVEETEAEYAASKTLAKIEKRLAEIEAAALDEKTTEPDVLRKLLSESLKMNKNLVEHSKRLYQKNKKAIEFINKGFDID